MVNSDVPTLFRVSRPRPSPGRCSRFWKASRRRQRVGRVRLIGCFAVGVGFGLGFGIGLGFGLGFGIGLGFTVGVRR